MLEEIELWAQLAIFSKRVLQPRGWLIAMSGQRHLPEVFERLSGLRYCWTIALRMPGESNNVFLSTPARGVEISIAERVAVNTFWKPILVYCKGEPQPWPEMGDLMCSPKPMKENHDWGQNVDVFSGLVEKFTKRGQLIVDPFLGGGTTAEAVIIAAGGLRQIEGFDVDAAKVKTARYAVDLRLKQHGELLEQASGGR